MSNQRFTPEFKDEAVRQIVDRGYSVAEVSECLGVSAHSLYKWVKAVKPDKTDQQAALTTQALEMTAYQELIDNILDMAIVGADMLRYSVFVH